MSSLTCCCGRFDCAYLDHNNRALNGLERDVETAAQLGQALLHRHESYMAESEEERRRMAANIDRLEQDKRELEAENAKMVEENHDLLDQVKGLNNTIDESDAHIKSLMATLGSAQFEIRRLTALAAKTSELEAQLVAMEVGQAQLEDDLENAKVDERTAMSRWRHAEVRLRDLHEQVEKIEKEARDERERHVELVGRMERRRTVEKELESAAGRLKGAAAASSLSRNKNGSNVVSHFVRDILQDNANLQAGIAELRELLQISNEDVQNLREQVLLHQPILGKHEPQSTPLSEEVGWSTTPKQVSQEVHVHHHYHPKASAKKDRLPLARRNSRKRGSIALLTPTGSPLPQTPSGRRQSQHSPSPAPLTTSIPYGCPRSNRFSVQSAATGFTTLSSVSNSPQSYFRNSAIFDRIDLGFESSRPTSPESAGYPSPHLERNGKDPSHLPTRTFEEVSGDEESPMHPSARKVLQPLDSNIAVAVAQTKSNCGYQDFRGDAISEENLSPPETNLNSLDCQVAAEDFDDHGLGPDPSSLDSGSNITTPVVDNYFLPISSSALRRSASHDSLVSISGMDIHLARRPPPHHFSLSKGISPLSAGVQQGTGFPFPSSKPLASIAEVNASSSNLASNKDVATSLSLLSGIAAAKPPVRRPQIERQGLGRYIGGWVRGKWGIAPMTRTGAVQAQETISSTTDGGDQANAGLVEVDVVPSLGRTPGINQKGPITGLRPPVRTPSAVQVTAVDEELLRESLAE